MTDVVNSARSEAQQTAISEALWRVMSRGGPQAVTLREVAAEAGCTTGLVMSRFPNKRALLLHARHMLHERTEARMAELFDQPDAARALFDTLMAVSLGPDFEAGIWLGFIAATLSDPELKEFHVTANRTFVDGIRSLVARLQPTWSREHTLDEAVRLASLVTGFAVLASPDPGLYSRGAHERAFIAAIAAVVAAPAE